MRHPESASLSRYLDDDLPTADREAIERHVRVCIPCRQMLASLSETVRVLGTLRARDPSEHAERIVAAVALRLTDIGVDRRAQLRAAVRYCLQRSQLRFTLPIAVLVGAALSLVNKGAMLLEGQIDLGMCAVCALDFLLPFAAMNIVLVSAAKVLRRS